MQYEEVKNKINGNRSLKVLFDRAVAQYASDWIHAAAIDFDALDAECDDEEDNTPDTNLVGFMSRANKELLERVKEIKVSACIKQWVDESVRVNTIALIQQNVAKCRDQSFEIVARRTLSQPLFPQIRHA